MFLNITLIIKIKYKSYLLRLIFNFLYSLVKYGGDKRDRTADLLRARQALSQLSYIPITVLTLRFKISLMVGLPGLEPGTSRLSVERSSQLSYRPLYLF